MPEIKKKPRIGDNEETIFDNDCSHADIIRYIMDDGLSAEEITLLAEIEKRERQYQALG